MELLIWDIMGSWTERGRRAPIEIGSANPASAYLESHLIDVAGCSLGELRSLDAESIARASDRHLRQLYQPRGNFGGTEQPDRVD